MVLISSFIWLLAFLGFTPECMPLHCQAQRVLALLARKDGVDAVDMSGSALFDFGTIFLFICVSSFLLANLWSLLRKVKAVEGRFNYITGRTWHPSVSFQFFQENMDEVVALKVRNNTYVGTLYAAPDSEEDRHIILKDISVYHERTTGEQGSEHESVPFLEQLLVKVDDIAEIQAYSEELTRPRRKK